MERSRWFPGKEAGDRVVDGDLEHLVERYGLRLLGLPSRSSGTEGPPRKWCRTPIGVSVGAVSADPGEESLLDSIRALAPALAEATLLHYWAGFSVEETARILRVPTGTVKSRLHRARAALGRALEDGGAISRVPTAAARPALPPPGAPLSKEDRS